MGFLPIEFERGVFVGEMVEAKIDRPHVQRRDLGCEARSGLHSVLDFHVGAAARGDVDNGVGALLDARQKPGEGLGRLIGLPRHGIAGVKMKNRRARVGRGDRLGGNLLRRDRQVGRHGRRMDGACHRAGDDDLPRPGRRAGFACRIAQFSTISVLPSPCLRLEGGSHTCRCACPSRVTAQSASTLPSTPSDWPEMLAPAAERRKATTPATSNGLVMRRSDMFCR